MKDRGAGEHGSDWNYNRERVSTKQNLPKLLRRGAGGKGNSKILASRKPVRGFSRQ